MRIVVQRVLEASVVIDSTIYSQIQNGLLLLVGIEHEDTSADIEWVSKKISQLRIFNDQKGQMNQSVIDVNGQLLVVSQFTLHAKIKKGNRPSFILSAKPNKALNLYNQFVEQISNDSGLEIKTGQFGANMQVRLTNDGPVTLIIDSKNRE